MKKFVRFFVTRPLRAAAVVAFLGYLALGPVFYRLEAAKPRQAELPMAYWSIPKIEAQSQRALHVVARPGMADPVAANLAEAEPEPQRLLPDLKPLEPYDVYTVGSRATGDLRLKFATTIYNAGQGPLETRGARNAAGQLEVYQYVYEGENDEAKQGRAVGTFDYNHRHGHLHFDEFAHYELWTLGANGEPLNLVADNEKVGFCLMDIKDMTTEKTHLESGLIGQAGGPVYAGCREDIQGISPGWGDEYVALLYEQDLDLTNIPGGRYALVITTNPNRKIEEADYQNNTTMVYVTLEGEKVVGTSESVAGS